MKHNASQRDVTEVMSYVKCECVKTDKHDLRFLAFSSTQMMEKSYTFASVSSSYITVLIQSFKIQFL